MRATEDSGAVERRFVTKDEEKVLMELKSSSVTLELASIRSTTLRFDTGCAGMTLTGDEEVCIEETARCGGEAGSGLKFGNVQDGGGVEVGDGGWFGLSPLIISTTALISCFESMSHGAFLASRMAFWEYKLFQEVACRAADGRSM